MNTRMIKGFIGWNVVLTFLLLGMVAANANLAEAANDPPVRVFNSTHDLNGGAVDQNTNDVLVQTQSIAVLAEVMVTLPVEKPHMCLATGSAEVEHQSGIGRYTLDLRLGPAQEASLRRFELVNNAGVQDPKYKEVSTVGAWKDLTGAHTIRFVARNVGLSNPDFQVTNASLIVICVKKVLG
jgi:hypothetical protein